MALDPPGEPDYSHVVFPQVEGREARRLRREEMARSLEATSEALAREQRDLVREARGQRPIEGVGTAVLAEPALPAKKQVTSWMKFWPLRRRRVEQDAPQHRQ